ncbi:MAG: hypothetical protein AAGC55_01885 [Myxococcota bacterium]
MTETAFVLLTTAASIGFVHTLVGVDHSLPFVVIGRSRGWSLGKLLRITALCGIAHILSSVAIGSIGLAIGAALGRMEWLEESRGGLAAWLLIGFGLAYAVWGLYRTYRGRRHVHVHIHEDGTVHDHEHDHLGDHGHVHAAPRANTVTVAALFVIFLLGPCEALIPLLMVPASEQSWSLVAAVVAVFGMATLATMLGVVTIGHYGLRFRVWNLLERHMTTVAGLAIALSGLAIQVLGV